MASLVGNLFGHSQKITGNFEALLRKLLRWGESLWFPTIHEDARPEGSWPHLDERYLEGRRRHVLEERLGGTWKYGNGMDGNGGATLVADYHYVEGATPNQPGLLLRFNFLKSLHDRSATVLVVGAGFIGVEWATEIQHFFPRETLSEKGPGGGGWILMNQNLSVKTRDGKLWGGDDKGYPREEMCIVACSNIEKTDRLLFQNKTVCAVQKEFIEASKTDEMPPSQRRVLIIGGSFSGLAAGRDLGSHYLVTIIDAKETRRRKKGEEYFEYTPGVLRAYVKPKHLDALTFTLQPVIETRMACKYIWGEVKELNGEEKTATYKPIFTSERDGVKSRAEGWGESLWFPTIHEDARPEGSWPHLDERYLEGRRRHVLEEFNFLKSLHDRSATVLVVGAGFIGVEWATEIQHFFPRVKLTVGIKQFYNTKYDAKNPDFWKAIEMPNGPDKEYVCIGVKASNYFMPKETLSEKGPGGGGWILMNQNLSVKTRDGKLWGGDDKGYPRIYAVCAVQKEFIEASKTDECAYGFIGRCIWYFVHHTPVHLFGGGPRWGY
eukprot:s226_g38.t1